MAFAWRLIGAVLIVQQATGVHAQGQSARVEQRGDAVVVQGRIDEESATRAIALIQDAWVTKLVITSGGGLVDASIDLAEAVNARALDVEVPVACMATCANYVLPAGRHKVLGRPAAVAWRGNMAQLLYLQRTGQGSWSDQELSEARRLALRESAFFARIGVDGFVCWFAKLPPYAIDEFFSLSVQDMAGFGIREVQLQDSGLPLTGGLVQEVSVDWAHLESIRPRAAPDP